MKKESENTAKPSASDNMYFTHLSTWNVKYNKSYSSSLQWVLHYKAQVCCLFFQHRQAISWNHPIGTGLFAGSSGNFKLSLPLPKKNFWKCGFLVSLIRDLLCHHDKALQSFTFLLQVPAAIAPEDQFSSQYIKHLLSPILPNSWWKKVIKVAFQNWSRKMFTFEFSDVLDSQYCLSALKHISRQHLAAELLRTQPRGRCSLLSGNLSVGVYSSSLDTTRASNISRWASLEIILRFSSLRSNLLLQRFNNLPEQKVLKF